MNWESRDSHRWTNCQIDSLHRKEKGRMLLTNCKQFIVVLKKNSHVSASLASGASERAIERASERASVSECEWRHSDARGKRGKEQTKYPSYFSIDYYGLFEITAPLGKYVTKENALIWSWMEVGPLFDLEWKLVCCWSDMILNDFERLNRFDMTALLMRKSHRKRGTHFQPSDQLTGTMAYRLDCLQKAQTATVFILQWIIV